MKLILVKMARLVVIARARLHQIQNSFLNSKDANMGINTS
jgi:hypothetical protein